MTNGSALASASASFITGANSRSQMTTLLPAWSSWKPIAVASSRVFSACRTAPVMGTP
jgi:hypothetical protein